MFQTLSKASSLYAAASGAPGCIAATGCCARAAADKTRTKTAIVIVLMVDLIENPKPSHILRSPARQRFSFAAAASSTGPDGRRCSNVSAFKVFRVFQVFKGVQSGCSM